MALIMLREKKKKNKHNQNPKPYQKDSSCAEGRNLNYCLEKKEKKPTIIRISEANAT